MNLRIIHVGMIIDRARGKRVRTRVTKHSRSLEELSIYYSILTLFRHRPHLLDSHQATRMNTKL